MFDLTLPRNPPMSLWKTKAVRSHPVNFLKPDIGSLLDAAIESKNAQKHTPVQTHTVTIVVFGLSPWKQPVQQCSHTAAHWFTASPCLRLAVGSAFQDKVNSQQAADRHLSSLWLCPHYHGDSAKHKCPVNLGLSVLWLQINIMPMCMSHGAPTNKLLAPSALKLSERESPTQADVWNPACHHTGLCCFPDAVCLYSCGMIVSLVNLWSKINTGTCLVFWDKRVQAWEQTFDPEDNNRAEGLTHFDDKAKIAKSSAGFFITSSVVCCPNPLLFISLFLLIGHVFHLPDLDLQWLCEEVLGSGDRVKGG